MSWGGVPGAPAVGVDGDREGTEPVPRAPVSHDFPAMTVRISEKCRREQSLGGGGVQSLPLQSEPWWHPSGFPAKARGNHRESWLRTRVGSVPLRRPGCGRPGRHPALPP